MKVPRWVSNVASIILLCIGAFFLLFGWSYPGVAQSWVIGTGGMALIIFVIIVFLLGRIKDLEGKVQELQKKN